MDLPGYGYAKRSKQDRLAWNAFTKDYFLHRENLQSVLLLVDASIPPQQIDLECVQWLTSAQVPYCIVFTKADKKKKKGPRPQENVDAFLATLQVSGMQLPDAFLTSAAEGSGGGDVMQYLKELRLAWLEEAEGADA